MTEAVIRTNISEFLQRKKLRKNERDKNAEFCVSEKISDIAGQTGHTPFKECPVPQSCPVKEVRKTSNDKDLEISSIQNFKLLKKTNVPLFCPAKKYQKSTLEKKGRS